MHVYIPTLRKIVNNSDVLIERSLPKAGALFVSKGDEVEPFKKIGSCKVSYEITELGSKFKPDNQYKVTNRFNKGLLVGKVGRTKFVAPYNGYLEKKDKEYIFRSEERDYFLLPGVWGVIEDVKDNVSVLLRTQSKDIHVPIATNNFKAGELIVFPNPGELLASQYLNNYLKSSTGKIIYVGNTVTADLLKKAKELDIEAILAGSANKDVFDYANNINMSLGLFNMFGSCETPDYIYNYLNEVSNRYVFFYGSRNILQIPTREKGKKADDSVLKYVRKGLRVQVLDAVNFGRVGTVDSATKSGIFVQLDKSDELVEVKPPNLLALD